MRKLSIILLTCFLTQLPLTKGSLAWGNPDRSPYYDGMQDGHPGCALFLVIATLVAAGTPFVSNVTGLFTDKPESRQSISEDTRHSDYLRADLSAFFRGTEYPDENSLDFDIAIGDSNGKASSRLIFKVLQQECEEVSVADEEEWATYDLEKKVELLAHRIISKFVESGGKISQVEIHPTYLPYVLQLVDRIWSESVDAQKYATTQDGKAGSAYKKPSLRLSRISDPAAER